MKTSTSHYIFLILSGCVASVSEAWAQSKPSPIVLAPPPVPPRPAPIDLATRMLDPLKVRAVMAAYEAWKQGGGGAEYFPGLIFIGGRPSLMLISDRNESLASQLRRKTAIVRACEFLLAAGSFDIASICIVEADRQRPGARPSTPPRTSSVTRNSFEVAAKNAGNTSDLTGALAAAKLSETAINRICNDIGVR